MARRNQKYTVDEIERQLYAVDFDYYHDVKLYGKVRYYTKHHRHYLLTRLLVLQLEEFNHGY